jgi:hypothetical protein
MEKSQAVPILRPSAVIRREHGDNHPAGGSIKRCEITMAMIRWMPFITRFDDARSDRL